MGLSHDLVPRCARTTPRRAGLAGQAASREGSTFGGLRGRPANANQLAVWRSAQFHARETILDIVR